ncbi:MAG: hypothetical protein FWG52_09910 [Proteobacteria bacterium]|nr:hypothetical protein [Pseudomonadota bacterium]
MNYKPNPADALNVRHLDVEPRRMDRPCYVMSEDDQNELKSAVFALRAILFIACESKATVNMDDLSGLLSVLHNSFEYVLDNLQLEPSA